MFIIKDHPSSSGDLKREAKAQLSGQWQSAILLLLIPIIIGVGFTYMNRELTTIREVRSGSTFVLDVVVGTGLLSWLINFLNYIFKTSAMFSLVDLVTKPDYIISPLEDLLQIFKDYNVLYFVKLYLLKTIYIFLWALLFIIPGIIKQLSYSQAEFIYKDYKELGKEITSNEAITLSREMMDGYKLDYFVLQLSFMGWYILEAFTFGLSALYSEPYANAAKAVFYRNISLKHFKNQGIIDDHAAGQTI